MTEIVREWSERIDEQAVAICVSIEETRSGRVYGASTFLLAERDRWWRHRDAAVAKLRQEIRAGKFREGFGYTDWRGLALRGYARDLRR